MFDNIIESMLCSGGTIYDTGMKGTTVVDKTEKSRNHFTKIAGETSRKDAR